MAKKSSLLFPKKFMWGAKVAAQPTEGGADNAWTDWEKDHARVLAAQAPYHYDDLESWQRVKKLASTPANYVSARASDHYDKYLQDFDLLDSMNLNAFRFGIDWSRVQPSEDTWDIEAIAHYKEYIAELKSRDIEPIVTLWQVALPRWFAEKGGFEKRSNVDLYVQYVEKMIEELGVKVTYFITMDAPTEYARLGYYTGEWPPSQKSGRMARKVLRNLIRAHVQAAKAIHAVKPRAKVSVAHDMQYVYAGDDAVLSEWSARAIEYVRNTYFLKRVYKHCDFLALSYRRSHRVYGYRVHNPEGRHTDTGWELTPEYLEQALVQAYEQYQLPVFVVGNGLADAEDQYRSDWIETSIRAMNAARAQDVKLLGYLHDSLVDGVEYDLGRWARHGLAKVDYVSGKRTLRESAVRYGKIVAKLRKGA